jgi:hypothetical protein
MSNERFDIEISDKVSPGVENKLKGIAAAALKAYREVEKLKGVLATLDDNKLAGLTSASARLTEAMAKETNAQARLQAARAKGAAEDAKAAIAKQKLATETARTDAAQQASVTATLRASTAAIQLEAAERRRAAALERESAALNANTAAQHSNNRAQAAGTNGARLQRHELLNLSYQIQDVIVGLASGQKPLTVLIQQGGQIGQIAASSGQSFAAMGRQIIEVITSVATKFLPAIVAVGALAATFGLLTREVNKTNNDQEALRKRLGLTTEEFKKLKNTNIGVMDVLKATFKVTAGAIYKEFKEPLDWLKKYFNKTLDFIVKIFTSEFDRLVSIVLGVWEVIKFNWAVAPKWFGNVAIAVYNVFAKTFEAIANGAIGFLNNMKNGMNIFLEAFGQKLIPDIPKIQLDTKEMLTASELAGQNNATAFMKGYAKGPGSGKKFAGAIGKQASKERDARLKPDAQKLIDARDKGSDGPKPFDRAAELDKINTALDAEIRRMDMLKDAREIENRMDEIKSKFIEEKMPLEAEEIKAIKAKVTAIQEYAKVQGEMDRIYSEVKGPMEAYNASLQAATELLAKGAITQQQADEQKRKATFTYNNATNALFMETQALEDQNAMFGLYGPALERAIYMKGIENKLLAEGKVLRDLNTGALTAEAQALMNLYDKNATGKFVQDQVNAALAAEINNRTFVDNYKSMLDAIEVFRQQDVANEGAANKAKAALQAQYQKIQLAGTQAFFGELSTLSSSSNKELAAIGKAAAIVQATINGYLAISEALASSSPPYNYIMAGAVAATTAANLANIMSTNVGGFATGGSFKVGGKQGRDRNNIAMDLTRGERVTVETEAQQRAADRASAPANDNVGMAVQMPRITINNNAPGSVATVESVGRDEIRIMIKETVERETPRVISKQVRDPNSRVSKDISQGFGLKRNR